MAKKGGKHWEPMKVERKESDSSEMNVMFALTRKDSK